MVRPRAKREAATFLRSSYQISLRRSCRVLGLQLSTAFYKPKPNGDEPIGERLRYLVGKHKKFGRPRLHFFLRKEGLVINEKRTRRIYEAMGLQLGKRKRRHKCAAVTRVPHPKPTKPNEVWSFDFMFDRTENNRRIKILTVVDDLTKRSPGLLVDHSITAEDLINFFESLPVKPKRLRCDNVLTPESILIFSKRTPLLLFAA